MSLGAMEETRRVFDKGDDNSKCRGGDLSKSNMAQILIVGLYG